jgi:hypothetical protein
MSQTNRLEYNSLFNRSLLRQCMRNVNEVIVGTQDEVYARRGLINRTTLTAAEIGDQIVRILEGRLVGMRAELQKLGVEYRGGIH